MLTRISLYLGTVIVATRRFGKADSAAASTSTLLSTNLPTPGGCSSHYVNFSLFSRRLCLVNSQLGPATTAFCLRSMQLPLLRAGLSFPSCWIYFASSLAGFHHTLNSHPAYLPPVSGLWGILRLLPESSLTSRDSSLVSSPFAVSKRAPPSYLMP